MGDVTELRPGPADATPDPAKSLGDTLDSVSLNLEQIGGIVELVISAVQTLDPSDKAEQFTVANITCALFGIRALIDVANDRICKA